VAVMMLNGELVQEADAKISVFDHGLLYGVGAFETLRIYDGHPFLLPAHLLRLHQALERMKIQRPHTEQEWLTQIQVVCQENELQNGSVRLSVTAGVECLGLSTRFYRNPTTLIFARPLSFDPVHLFQVGKELQVVSVLRQAPGGVESFKTHNYLNSILARQALENFPAVEGLMLTAEGFLAEGIMSNLFFIIKESIYTPDVGLGILDGVTRKFVIKLARELGYPVEEGCYTLAHLQRADEIFITSSLQEIVPVVYGNQSRRLRRGKITQHLYEAYQRCTGRDGSG
jgi:4-amino-4-deoxychorismate lyase